MHGPSPRRTAICLLLTLASLAPGAASAVAGTVVGYGNLPDVVVDRDGVTHLVFNERLNAPGSTDVLHYCQVPREAVACTNEKTFAPPHDPALSSWDYAGPKVMISPFGEVVLLTHRFDDNLVYISDDGGATFSGPTALGTVPPGEPSVATPAVFDGADRRIITISAPTGGIHLQGAPLGQYTTAFAQLSTENSYDPTVVQRARGSFAAAWSTFADNGTVFVRTYDCEGCPLAQLNSAANWAPAVAVPEAELPRLTTGPNGTFLLYRSRAAATDRQWMIRRVEGTAVGPPAPVSELQAGASRDILEDPSGLFHVAYIGNGTNLSYRSSADAAAWGDATILAPGPDFTIAHPRLAARTTDAGFTGYALWESNSGGEQNPPIVAAALPDPAVSLPKPPPPPPSPGGGTTPPPPPPTPPDPCRTLSFAAVDVIADACFTRDGTAYVATGGVRINGLRVELGSAKLRLDPKARTISSRGAKITLKAGDTVLWRDDLDWQLPKGSVANLGSLNVGGAGGKLFGFPLAGSASFKLRGGGSELALHLGLPAIFGGVTGDVTLRADNVAGVHLRELHVKVGNAYLGALQIKDLAFDYDADKSTWQGGATLILPPQPPGPSLESHVGFTGGELDYLRNELTLPGPGIALDPFAVVYLHKIRFGLETKPSLALTGGVTITAGPTIAGVAAIGVDGDLRFTFPNAPQPASLRVDGQVSLLDIPLGSAYFELRTNGYVGFGGKLDYDIGSFEAKATLDGWLLGKAFNVEANASVCLGDLGCRGGAVVVSSEGFAGCAYTDIADFGGGMHWGDSFKPMFSGCDIGPYRATLAQAGGDRTVRLKAGLPAAFIAVRGDGAPPHVALVGPSGQRIDPPADAPLKSADAIAFHMPEEHTTYFVLRRPAAGTWRVEAAADSSRVVEVRAADGLAEPSVKASVQRGRGGTRVLRYRVAPRPGQRVTFAEQGKGAARQLGVARGSTGTIRFTPADGPGGTRQIIAVVTTNGVPRATLKVARYIAPPPRGPAAPRALRARRAGTRLSITWGASRGASRYQVRVALSDGRRLLFVQRGRRVLVPRVTRTTRATVTVRGLKPDGLAGRPATLRVRLR